MIWGLRWRCGRIRGLRRCSGDGDGVVYRLDRRVDGLMGMYIFAAEY